VLLEGMSVSHHFVFSTFTLLAGHQEGHPSSKNLTPAIPQRSFYEHNMGQCGKKSQLNKSSECGFTIK